ncbi:MAG: NlpC/P60 family protein [Acidimicrobiales bacterium]
MSPQGDPLAGLTMPPGDPGPLGGAATRLTSWANLLGSGAAGHRSAASSVVGSAWIGPAASTSGMSIDALASAACLLADGANHASAMLTSCEARWNEAKALWQRAEQLATEALADEANHRQLAALAASAPNAAANPAALSQAQAAASGTDGYASPLRAQAQTLAKQAISDAEQAITAAAQGLQVTAGSVPSVSAASLGSSGSSSGSTVATNASIAGVGTLAAGGGQAGGVPSAASEQTLIADAKGWLGVPYVYGGTSRSGVDCSGFTEAVYSQMGIQIGRDTADQLRSGQVVGTDGNWAADVKLLQPGDLIFYGQPGAGGPNAHVVMYIGNGQVIQAPYTGQNVQISQLFSSASADEPFLGVRRYLPSAPMPDPTSVPGTVTTWINQAIAATGVPASWAPGLAIIAQHESSDNPLAVNNTDSNALAGHPSEGLCQVIQPTFDQYALSSHTNILNPVDNTIAAIRYIQARYGTIDNVPGVAAVLSGGAYVGY